MLVKYYQMLFQCRTLAWKEPWTKYWTVRVRGHSKRTYSGPVGQISINILTFISYRELWACGSYLDWVYPCEFHRKYSSVPFIRLYKIKLERNIRFSSCSFWSYLNDRNEQKMYGIDFTTLLSHSQSKRTRSGYNDMDVSAISMRPMSKNCLLYTSPSPRD